MGWRNSGPSQRPAYRVIPYGNAEETAAEAERALAYWDAEVYLYYGEASVPVVCCVRRGHTREDAEFLLPGRQLVVGCDGGWRIEAATGAAETAVA
jgi:hypothetical protein